MGLGLIFLGLMLWRLMLDVMVLGAVMSASKPITMPEGRR